MVTYGDLKKWVDEGKTKACRFVMRGNIFRLYRRVDGDLELQKQGTQYDGDELEWVTEDYGDFDYCWHVLRKIA